MPLWAAELEWAAAFGVDPSTVGAVKARWWIRWQLWRSARNSRQAWEYYKANPHAENLSPPMLEAMHWANE